MKRYEGFKLKDTYEINTWFLNIIPNMVQVLKDNNKGYPQRFHKEYYEEHKNELEGVDEFVFTCCESRNLSKELKLKQKEMEEYSWNKWNSILDRMINLFNEAKVDCITDMNEYQHKCKDEALALFVEYFDDLWW